MTARPNRDPSRSRIAGGVKALFAALLLSACAGSDEPDVMAATPAAGPTAAAGALGPRRGPPSVDPYAQFVIIGPSPRFDPLRLPDSWYGANTGGGPLKIASGEKAGIVALRFEADSQGSILGRRLDIPLLNMPYLRWGWYLEPEVAGAARTEVRGSEPEVLLRIVVGFRMLPHPAPAGDFHGPPKIDRTLSLEWRAAAQSAATAGSVPMRAGRHEAGRWIIEAVDLSRLFSAVWPRDSIAQARLVFVAAGAGPTAVPATGYIAEVVLSP